MTATARIEPNSPVGVERVVGLFVVPVVGHRNVRRGTLKAEGDGRQRRSHHHRLDVRPRNRGSIQFVVRLARLGRLKRRRRMTEPWEALEKG